MLRYEIEHIKWKQTIKDKLQPYHHILVLYFKKIPFNNLLPHHSYITIDNSIILISIHYVAPTSDSYQSHLAE